MQYVLKVNPLRVADGLDLEMMEKVTPICNLNRRRGCCSIINGSTIGNERL